MEPEDLSMWLQFLAGPSELSPKERKLTQSERERMLANDRPKEEIEYDWMRQPPGPFWSRGFDGKQETPSLSAVPKNKELPLTSTSSNSPKKPRRENLAAKQRAKLEATLIKEKKKIEKMLEFDLKQLRKSFPFLMRLERRARKRLEEGDWYP